MTEWVEQKLCLKFCVKLEHSSMETIQMIQKAAAMGNWWLSASSWRHMTTHASHLLQSFLAKHQIIQVTQTTYSPDLAPCDFWLFPKLKSPLKRKILDCQIQENMTGQLMVIGRTVWDPKVPALKGTETSLSCVQCFSYLSIYVSIFSYYMAEYFLDRPFMYTYIIYYVHNIYPHILYII